MQPMPTMLLPQTSSTLQVPMQQMSSGYYRVPSQGAQPMLVQQPSTGYRVPSQMVQPVLVPQASISASQRGQPVLVQQQSISASQRGQPVLMQQQSSGGGSRSPAAEKAAAGLQVLSAALGGMFDSQGPKINRGALVKDRRGADVTKRYNVEDEALGEGAMGKVYTATKKQQQNLPAANNTAMEHSGGDKKVAIKKMFIWDSDMKDKYEQEATVMKKLDHPNICKLLETYQKGRFMYFVMELCEGGDVFDRCMDTPDHHFSEQVAATVIKQAANALTYAHKEHGIVHRDIKPENMMFVSNDPGDNYVKVIDWGLAFQLGNGKMASAVGSFSYMAPEVLQSDMGGAWCMAGSSGYTSSCDLFSLGVVTYVLLCGRPPFWGSMDRKLDMLKQMKSESYPMNDEVWKGISPHAKDFVQRLLKANPNQRISGEQLKNHPWLNIQHQKVDPKIAANILRNMQNFSRQNNFFAMCVTSIAQQLDHSSLRDVHKVFTELDTDGDGVLRVDEIKRGFGKMFATNPQQMKDLEEMFQKLDTDGSGVIDYTEFCAAGIGERIFMEEGALWAAFEAFDVQEEDGKISKDEIVQMLKSGDVRGVWSQDVCNQVASEIMNTFDEDHNGYLTFDEWLELLRRTQRHQKGMKTLKTAANLAEIEEMEQEFVSGDKGTLEKAHTVMRQLDALDRQGAPSPAVAHNEETFNALPPNVHLAEPHVAPEPQRHRHLRRWFPSCFSKSNVHVPGGR